MSRTILIVDDEVASAHADPPDPRGAGGRGRRAADRDQRRRGAGADRVGQAEPGVPRRMMPKLSGFDVCERAKQRPRPDRRLHRPAHRQGPGVRPPARPGGRRRSLHDQALRSRRAAEEGARRARPVTASEPRRTASGPRPPGRRPRRRRRPGRGARRARWPSRTATAACCTATPPACRRSRACR